MSTFLRLLRAWVSLVPFPTILALVSAYSYQQAGLLLLRLLIGVEKMELTKMMRRP